MNPGPQEKDECQEAVAAVYSYLDGEIGWWAKRKVHRHLVSCRGCADAVEFEKAFLLRIKVACGDAPCGEELVEKVRQLLLEMPGDE